MPQNRELAGAVTPEMIEVGRRELAGFNPDFDSPSAAVTWIYEAMERARRRGISRGSDAYDPYCPDCGHVFSLADLRHMAVGDGWQRYLWVRLEDGSEKIVAFDEFDPRTMTDITPPPDQGCPHHG